MDLDFVKGRRQSIMNNSFCCYKDNLYVLGKRGFHLESIPSKGHIAQVSQESLYLRKSAPVLVVAENEVSILEHPRTKSFLKSKGANTSIIPIMIKHNNNVCYWHSLWEKYHDLGGNMDDP